MVLSQGEVTYDETLKIWICNIGGEHKQKQQNAIDQSCKCDEWGNRINQKAREGHTKINRMALS